MVDSETTDYPESYYAILDAAVEEFAAQGYAGVRMEHVARRAGFNKSLVYRFFKNRESLFQAALRRKFTQREELLAALPTQFGELLAWWSEKTRNDPLFMRMILREAIEDTGAEPVASEERTDYYQKQVDMLKVYQKNGQLPAALDSQYLFLALLSITVLPTALPQVCRLVTGLDSESVEFTQQWKQFLGGLSEHLADGD